MSTPASANGDGERVTGPESDSDGTGDGDGSPSTVRQWGVLLAAWLLAVGGSAYLIAPASVLPPMMAGLAVGPTAVGWILSVSYAGEAVVGLPAGFVMDRFDNRHVTGLAALALLVAGVWGFSAGSGGDYLGLLASRFLGGMGFAVLWIASMDVAGRTFGDAKRGTAVGAYTTAGPAGLAVGLVTGPLVAGLWGWAAVFVAYGGVMVVALALFWLLSRAVTVELAVATPPSGAEFGRVLCHRNLWRVAAMAFAAYSLLLFFTGWMPTYLAATYDLSLAASGLSVALFPAVGVLSRAGGGLVSDRLLGRRRRPVALVTFVAATPLVVAVALVRSPWAALLFLALAGFFVQVGVGLFFTYGSEFVPANVGGAALAFLNTTGILGSFTAPIVTGALIEWSGSYLPAFAYAAVLAAFGVGVALSTPEPGPRGTR